MALGQQVEGPIAFSRSPRGTLLSDAAICVFNPLISNVDDNARDYAVIAKESDKLSPVTRGLHVQKFKDFRRSGAFRLSSGEEIPGELSLKGGATALDLYSNAFFDTHASRDIFGTFHDRSKVSLIDCITMSGPGTGSRGEERYHFSKVFPHFVVFGDQHISFSDRKIAQASFAVDDAPSLFYDFEAFGTVLDAHPHMKRIAEAKEGGRLIEIGEHPHIFYFTGKHDIFTVDTLLGQISATHGISYSYPGPEGIHVKNTIRMNIMFATDRTIQESVEAVIDTLRFLEVIAGRPQNILELALRLSGTTEEPPQILDTYWCLPPRRENDDSRKPHPADLPLQAGMYPDKFASVLARWLERHDDWRNARTRYATASACQNRYEIDRLVGAANMFDILPASACLAVVSLTPEVEKARDDARKMFRALPPSPERESVLNALGRIGKATLKRKIRSRVKLIADVVDTHFPELDLVTDQAVDCRNYFVHGTPTKIDYGRHSAQLSFFTDTLEFVFAASDLIESGWDITNWIKEGTTMSHPFGCYRVNYGWQLGELKKLL